METIKPYYELADIPLAFRTFYEIFKRRPPECFVDFAMSIILFKRVVLNIGAFDDWVTEQYERKHPDHTGDISLEEMTRDLGGDDGAAFIKALIGETKHEHKQFEIKAGKICER